MTIMTDQQIDSEAVEQAARRIGPVVRRTPLLALRDLSAALGGELFAKPEYLQPNGSFKIRGAANAILALSAAERGRGVVCASTGNHARAVAYLARQLGIACTVCMSALVPDNKRGGVERLGAEVRIVGRSQDEAQGGVDRLVAARGLVAIPPFDDPAVIAGQGTIGREIAADLPDVARVLVPLSGGGLISGIALAVKAKVPGARVIGVSMERGAAMAASQKAGRPVEVREEETLADSLGGGIGLANRHSFRLVRELVDDIVLVSEAEIAAAIAAFYWREQIVCEGAAAVGLAALLGNRLPAVGGKTVLVVSGRNIDMQLHHRLVARAGLAEGAGAPAKQARS
jgi:threonine dehydratase